MHHCGGLYAATDMNVCMGRSVNSVITLKSIMLDPIFLSHSQPFRRRRGTCALGQYERRRSILPTRLPCRDCKWGIKVYMCVYNLLLYIDI